MSPKSSRIRKGCLFIPIGITLFCLLGLAVSYVSNISLPQASKTTDTLSDLEKARLSEALHLRKLLGDATWPGWSEADIPVILYNEKYAFLIGYPNPPSGWKKVPTLDQRGGAWEAVPGDTFEGQAYYRTPITDPQKTPQSFVVMVGDRWVATFQTREYSQVYFYRDFRQQLPPLISKLVPLRLAYSLLMGKTDAYIAAIEHESFHAYEGMLAKDRLDASESTYSVAEHYPFDEMDQPWKQEMDVLLQAVNAGTDAEAINLARQFLQLRESRRTGLTPNQVEYENLREWEEGLAKYAELEITRLADGENGYQPVEAMAQDAGFDSYAGRQRFWNEQLKEAATTSGRSGDTRFYYSGNAIAVLLDHLSPGWKSNAVPGGEYLDALLQQAVK